MRSALRAALLASALFAAGAAEAQQAPAPPRTITVSGHADTQVVPDLADISVGVTTKAGTPSAAIDANSAAAAKVIEAARKAGLDTKDIRTGTLSLAPAFRNVRDASGSFNQQPDGYTVTNSVDLRVKDLARLGAVLRDTVGEGANTISGLSFGVADTKAIEDDLRRDAVRDAKRRAEMLAETAGAKLGPVQSIREGSAAVPPPRPMMAEMRMAAPKANVPIAAGSLEFSSDVSVTWTLE